MRKIQSLRDKLLENRVIHPLYGCWLWTLGRKPNGYGEIKWKGKTYTVHRLAYVEFKGKEPKNHVLHKLECPHKHCFNPDHLYDGTNIDNYLDREIFGQNHGLEELNNKRRNVTHCPKGHEYTSENTRIDRAGTKRCIACQKLRGDRCQ
jgi:hypothetical protein